MLTPLLFWLLSHLPVFPPPAGDVSMFPPRAWVRESLIRHEGHLRWVRVQIDLCANQNERRPWYAYLDECRERRLCWRTLDALQDWTPGGNQRACFNCRGISLCPEDVVRLGLQELREQIGLCAYYGGALPHLPQCPRLELETIPLPSAGK